MNGKRECEYFPVGSEENGYEIAKEKATLFRIKMENEIPEYKEALLTKPGFVPIPTHFPKDNIEEIEKNHKKILKLRGIIQSNTIGFDGVRFIKNSWVAEWNKNGKHYSKGFDTTRLYDYQSAYRLAISYYKNDISRKIDFL